MIIPNLCVTSDTMTVPFLMQSVYSIRTAYASSIACTNNTITRNALEIAVVRLLPHRVTVRMPFMEDDALELVTGAEVRIVRIF